ncbi:hypothetical protein SteCoe_19380 [Stentor coeruleus]|uniref:Uncharacterized protein n=1 Tax=Stentor coeruleus TaxID=5963 RepID=A0A1R2BUY3_9CILI|nr:hypothetical protein SteCoe_19380 [Stentor coeruleus]
MSFFPFISLFVFCYARHIDSYYELAKGMLDHVEHYKFEEIYELLVESMNLGNPESFTALGELYLFGNIELNIERNFKLAGEYLEKAVELGSNRGLFFAYVITQENLLTNEFEEIDSIIQFEKFPKKFTLSSSKSEDLLKLAQLSAIYECIKSRNHTTPAFLLKSLENDSKPAVNFPYLEDETCNLDEETTYSALLLAYHGRNHIEKLGKPEHNFKRIDLEMETIYGENAEKQISLLSKHFETHRFTPGMISLSKDYIHGNQQAGIEPDATQAKELLDRAINLGDYKASADLGNMYYKGLGVDKNITKALEYFNQAKEANSVDAYRILSIIYQRGDGVEVNNTLAFEYAKTAAELGDVQSINNLGVYYMLGIGVEVDKNKGIELMNKSAILGSFAAKYNVGCLYFNGEDIEKDFNRAFKLFMEVIYEAQIDGFMAKAYKMFRAGDLEGSYLNFISAAALGYQEARRSLVYLFDKDLNVSVCKMGKEYCMGVWLYRSIIENGDKWSYTKLAGILLKGGESFLPDLLAAHEYYQNAPVTGEILYKLAYMYENGIGCNKDIEKALELYERIIYLSKKREIDLFAMYPAMISLNYLKLKKWVHSILGEWNFIEIFKN